MKRAQASIRRKGAFVRWVKADTSDTTTEFPTADGATVFGVYMVFYPAARQNLYTVIAEAITGSFTNQQFAVMAGGLQFKPEIGDSVWLPDHSVLHVETINITQPDLVPIIYELSFK